MKLPFTIEEFLSVFEKYNNSIWPLQVLFHLLAVAAVVFILKRVKGKDKTISFILSFLWLWMGIAYHFYFFTGINKAAWLFGAFFILQGLFFLYYGAYRNSLSFAFRFDARGIAGTVIIVYALLVYPLLSRMVNHVYPHTPTFGLPCPTVIFTFGLLLWAHKCRPLLLVIPFFWSLAGFSAALQLGMYEDFGLPASGAIAAIFLWRKNRPAASNKKIKKPVAV